MTVLEALRKGRRLKWLGRLIKIAGSVQLLMFALLVLYDAADLMKPTFLGNIGVLLQELVLIPYRATMPYAKSLWDITPRMNPYEPISSDMLMMIGIFATVALGSFISATGRELCSEVATVQKKARDELWLRSMLPPGEGHTVINQPASVTVLHLQMPPSEVRNWWEKPLGMLLLGVAISYIATVLAKLTGMV